MLAMSDRNGDVFASVPGLAKRAGVTMQECETAITAFLSPDAYSRTKDHEGRRIAEIDGGWTLLNHAKYRALLSAEERKEYNRRKQAERRGKLKNQTLSMTCQTMSNNVSKVSHTEAEAEAEAEAKSEKKTILTIKESKSKAAIEIYNLYPKKVGKEAALKAIKSALGKIDEQSLADAVAAFALAKQDTDPQFIPNPATWFNQGRWTDDRETWKPRPIGNFGVKQPSTYGQRHGNDVPTQEQIDNFLK